LKPRITSKDTPELEPDEALVISARVGTADAFDALVARHQDRVYNMAYRILGNREDALDLSQEVFLTVFKNLDHFEERSRFGTWLYRVTVNRCRDELRRRSSIKHTRPASLDAMRSDDDARGVEPAAATPSPADCAVGRETQGMVERAIAGLPEEAREALVLRDSQGFSYDEIADVLEVPVGTVRSRLNRARTLLKEQLRPILDVEP